MKTFKKLILAIQILQVMNASCGEGCMSCNSMTNTCNLCDQANKFFYSQGTNSCVRRVTENCFAYDFYGNCLKCNENYFLDINTQTCVEVLSNCLIDNCLEYETQQTCQKCETNYYLQSNTCILVESTIQNCLFYSSANLCAECQLNFTLSLDQMECVANPIIDNCKAFTNVACEVCPVNSIEIEDANKQIVRDLVQNENNIQQLWELLFGRQTTSLPIESICYMNRIDNCRKYKDFETCKLCQNGYQVYEGECYRSNTSIIQNCAQQLTSNTCEICEENYYLMSLSKCNEIKPFQLVDNCAQYTTLNNKPVCSKCEAQFYVSSEQICVTRINNSIDSCAVYSANSDTCQQCDSGKLATTNGEKCLEQIQNCQIYNQTSSTDTQHTCAQCKSGFYLQSDTQCQEGSVDNCEIYTVDSNTCEKCDEGYMLEEQQCVERTYQIQNCKEQSQLFEQVCVECDNGYQKMQFNIGCQEGQINNCKIYSSEYVCEECYENYELIDSTTCDLIQNQMNRLATNLRTEQTLPDCPEGTIIKNDICQDVFEYELQNCDVLNNSIQSSDLLDQECQICSTNSIPYNLQDHYVCVSQSELQNIFSSTDQILIDNCIAYADTDLDNSINCTKCQEGYILYNNMCNSNCFPDEQKFTQIFHQDSQNLTYNRSTVCVNQIDGADSIVYDQDLQPTAFELQNGYQYEMELKRTDTKYKIVENSQIDFLTNSNDLFKLPMHKDILQLPIDQVVENCMFYADRGDNIYVCQACKFGYFSEITNIAQSIDNCYEYTDNFLCSKCIQGYILSDDNLTCTLSNINNCVLYELNTANCLLCEDNYYRQDLITCTPNSIQNCQIKNKFDNTCIKCTDGFYSVENQENNITQCIQKIDNCQEHQYESNVLVCINCQLGYYPTDSNRTSCTQGNIDDCIEYDQQNINTCLYYDNIYIKQESTCVDQNTIYGCQIYNNERSQCLFCQSDKQYYPNEGLCCDFGTYPNSGDNNQNTCSGTSSNCKIWQYNSDTSSYECSQCMDNYNLDPQTRTCCNVGQQVVSGTCSSTVPFSSINVENCQVYDFDNRICKKCVVGKYLSNGVCCDIGQYNDQSGVCINIFINNCEKIESGIENCDQCESNYILFNNECLEQPSNLNCEIFTYDQVSGFKCESCIDNSYYIVENNIACCLKKSDTTQAQIWNQTLNQGDGGCEDVPDEYIIDNCEIYDQEKNCQQCLKDQYDNILYASNNSQCCLSQLTAFEQNCILTSYLYQNCISINMSNFDFCSSCQNGYYESNGICIQQGQYFPLDTNQNYENPITQDITTANTQISEFCLELKDDKTECTKCQTGYKLVEDNKQICCTNTQYYNSIIDRCEGPIDMNHDCFLYDTLNDQCLYIQSDDNFTFITTFCRVTEQVIYYGNDGQQTCCPYGQHIENGICVDNLENCKFQTSTTSCDQCNEGYYFDSNFNSCEQVTGNCFIMNSDAVCQVCADGYQRQETNTGVVTCEEIVNITTENFKNQKQCKFVEIDSNNLYFCTECLSGYVLSSNVCCEAGTQYDQNSGECIQVFISNCVVLQSDSFESQCQTCFVDEQNYIYKTNYTLIPLVGSLEFMTQNVSTPLYYQDNYEIGQTDCCKQGQYRKDNTCVDIDEQLNCLQGYEDLGQFKCTQCTISYYVSENKCCKTTEFYNTQTGQCENDGSTCIDRTYEFNNQILDYYVSNGECCKQNFYYDYQQKQCIPHPDPNCLQSDSKYKCQQCIQSYSPSDFYVKAEYSYVNIYGEQYIQDEFYFKICLNFPINDSDIRQNQYLYNCVDNDSITFQCNECQDGYYLEDGYCCQNDQFHINQICIDKSIVTSNCLQYDQSTFECINCDAGYHVSGGVCCLENYEFNYITQQCIQSQNCQYFINQIGLCGNCNIDSYSLNGQCCQNGTYHDLQNNTCVIYDNSSIQYCLRGTQTVCTQCQNTIDESGTIYNVYLSDGICCEEGQYNQNGLCVDIPTSENCLQYRNMDTGQCHKCQDGYYSDSLYNKCCLLNYYYNSLEDQCKQLDDSCSQAFMYEQQLICQECNYQNDYYKTNGGCCLIGFYQESFSYTPNCIEINSDTSTQVCEQCPDGEYISDYGNSETNNNNQNNTNRCCPFYQYFSNGSCLNISDITLKVNMQGQTQCKKVEKIPSGQYQCIECENSNLILIEDNIQGGGNQTQVSCQPNTQFTNCSYQDNTSSTQECLKCYDPYNYYPSGKNCCKRGLQNGLGNILVQAQIEDSSGQCISDNQTNQDKNIKYIHVNKVCCGLNPEFDVYVDACDGTGQLDICLKIQNDVCVQCNNSIGYYLVIDNNQCCQSGQTIIDGQCAVPQDNGLIDCQVFQNSTQCRNLTQEEIQEGSLQDNCQNGKYLSNAHCCDLGTYWNGLSCVTLQDPFQNCIKLNNQICIECQSDQTYYISNGVCCVIGFYFNGTSCVQINQDNFQDCDQLDSNQCINCTSGTLTQDGCCQINATNIGDQCVNNISNCEQMSDSTSCYQCQDNYYVTNGNCCQNNQEYVVNICQDITIRYPDQVYCLQIDQNGNCIKCEDGKSLTNGRCCDSNQYFDINLSQCVAFSSLENCIKIDSSFNCIESSVINYQSNNNNCLIGKYYNTNTSTCEDIPIEGCNQADDPTICLQCQIDMSLQGSICCPARRVIILQNGTFDDCISIDILIQNCDNFNTFTLVCDNCQNGYYREESQQACCEIGKKFDNTSQTCIDISANNCNKQVDTECLECADNYYLTGSSTIQCCQISQYVNTLVSTSECVDITIDNCLKATLDNGNEVCMEYASNVTCNIGEVYNQIIGQCQEEIQYCSLYSYDTNNQIICQQCTSNNVLLYNQTICCPPNTFYSSYTNSCSQNLILAETDCATVDVNNFVCTSCGQEQYLTDDNICCDYGTYRNGTEIGLQCNGNIDNDFNTSNCSIYRQNCVKCMSGYVLNDIFECVKIPTNCEIFDEENLVCVLCNDDNLYVSNGICCAKGTYNNGGTCEQPVNIIENCQEYQDGSTTQCKLCADNYYVNSQQICCQNGYFCVDNTSSESGNISNCKEYGTNLNDCTKCKDGDSLAEILNEETGVTIKYCLAFNFDNCLYPVIINDNNENLVQCSECIAGKIPQNNASTIVNEHEYNVDQNCIYYEIKQTLDQSTLKCQKCNSDYYLNNENICILRSKSTTNCIQIDQKNDTCLQCDFGYVLENNECQEIQINNCDIPFTLNECAACTSGFTLLGDTNISTLDQSLCVDNNEIPNYTTNGTQSIPTIGTLENCVEHTQCDDLYLNGLDPEISKYISCHKCIDDSQIPFIHLRIENNQDDTNQLDNGILIQDYFNIQTFGSDLYLKNHSSECYAANTSDFNISDTNTFDFPENCGAGAINGNSDDLSLNQTDQENIDLSTSTLSVFCVACKPGYKPTYSNINFHIIECTEIQFCQEYGSAFNQCDICETGYAFQYDKNNNLVNKDTCVQTQPLQNYCYAYNETENKCQTCQKGYSRNVDGICENIQITKCKDDKSNIQNSDYILSEYQVVYYRGDIGCQECQDGYYRFLRQQDDYVCLGSTYVENNIFLDDVSFLEENCQRYQNLDGNITCFECDENYVISVQNTCIAQNQNLNNCQIAQDEDNCQTCIEGDYYLNDLNICTLKNIEFCAVYTNTQQDETCETCLPFYYLDENICIRGQIQGCQVYVDENNCEICREGYNQMQNDQNNDICVQDIQIQNCLIWNPQDFAQGILTCQKCECGYFPKALEPSIDLCYPLLPSEGCEIYDNIVTYQNQVPDCLQCKSDYYMENKKCYKRQVFDENCIQYHINQDKCMKCALDYYLENLGRNCRRQIIPVDNCRLYSADGSCKVCNSHTYLSGGQCIEVEQQNIVNNCYVYNEDQTCRYFQSTNYLFNDECQVERVQGCASYTEINTCQRCQEGYHEYVKNGLLKCKKKKNISFCRKLQSDEPYYCEACSDGYYPVCEGMGCRPLKNEELIENCYQYDQQKNCAQCYIDYVLSSDSQSCIPIGDAQMCLRSQELEEPICAMCDDGYTLNEDNQCERDTAAVENCLIMSNYDTNSCAICVPGYYMVLTQNCIQGNYED